MAWYNDLLEAVPFVGDLASAGVNAIVNHSEKNDERDYQEKMQEKQWQREDALRNEAYSRDDAKYSRLTKDLKNAGINPMLAVTSTTASQSSPSVSTASPPSGPTGSRNIANFRGDSYAQTMMQKRLNDAQIRNLEAQSYNQVNQGDAAIYNAQTNAMNAETNVANAQTAHSSMLNQAREIESRIATNEVSQDKGKAEIANLMKDGLAKDIENYFQSSNLDNRLDRARLDTYIANTIYNSNVNDAIEKWSRFQNWLNDPRNSSASQGIQGITDSFHKIFGTVLPFSGGD